MQCLYAVSISGSGKLICFSGAIPENRFEEVERIANKIGYSMPENDFCDQFEATIRTELGIELEREPIKYIFRVRKSERLPLTK